METVTINISRASVLADMKVMSHGEVAVIADPTERYLAELGTEKEEAAQQCITDAATEVRSVLRPMLAEATAASATDAYDTGAIAYAMRVTERKAHGLADALTKAVHAYIVDAALDKFYGSVSRNDLAERHRARLAAEMATIGNIIYHRTAPSYVPYTPTSNDNPEDNDSQE